MNKKQGGYVESDTIFGIFVGCIILLVIIFGVVFAASYANSYANSRTTTDIYVKDKERITMHKSGYYLVYDKNETFAIKDTFIFGRFNSSDLYGQLEKNKSYHCDVAGWRMPFFSMYRNLLKCEAK